MNKEGFSYAIKTMGCKANVYDSLIIEKELREMGGVASLDSKPDLFIVNSCTVTAQADKQCLKEVQNVKKKSPDTWALVTGCFAQVDPEKISSHAFVDAVVPGLQKNALKNAVASHFKLPLQTIETDSEIYWGQMPLGIGNTRAFLKIQEGCNDFCTYCIIPYARGKSRSERMGKILAEIIRLSESGVSEVVLTGTNIADYGKEFDLTLDDLIQAILTQTKLKRLRLTSLDPTEISDRLLEMMKTNSRLMPHFHVSLQSAVSPVLRAMKRHYRTEEVESCLNKIYQTDSNIFVGMDLIAGFPSETLAHHNEGVGILKNLPWTRLHVFPYSERTGTPALKIKESVEVTERKRRTNELISLSNQRHETFCKKFIGKTISNVLFETSHEAALDFYISGHSANYMNVLARVPSRSQADAEAQLKKTGSVQIVGYSAKSSLDFTLEGVLSST